jgi:L-asparagine oxygenase
VSLFRSPGTFGTLDGKGVIRQGDGKYSTLPAISGELTRHGYIFLRNYRPAAGTLTVAQEFGSPLTPWDGGPVQALTPRAEATPNTYSGIYGLDRFPFHTDLAHWRAPPRYLLLRCVTGYPDVSTLLIDGRGLVEAVTLDILARAIFRPRRPREGTLSLLRLCESTDDGHCLRWDEVFLKPASKIGDIANLRVREWLSKCEPAAISLAKTHDTLLIDNWRMLHARSPIPAGREGRAIERVYLEGIN